MKSILSQTSWWIINKSITNKIGVDASILLSDLLSKQEMFEQSGRLDEEGYFYQMRDDLENSTTLSLHKQNKALKKLKGLGIVDFKNKGIPPRTYFRIDEKKLDEFLFKIRKIGF